MLRPQNILIFGFLVIYPSMCTTFVTFQTCDVFEGNVLLTTYRSHVNECLRECLYHKPLCFATIYTQASGECQLLEKESTELTTFTLNEDQILHKKVWVFFLLIYVFLDNINWISKSSTREIYYFTERHLLRECKNNTFF